MDVAEYIKKVAIPKGKYHFHKDLNGKLTGYVPSVGQSIVLEGFDEIGRVIKAPNSAKDFLVELPDGTKIRKNLVNKDIEGFIDA